MVAVVDEGVVVQGVLDVCAHGRGFAGLRLLDADVRLLLAELGRFQGEALFLGLLEACVERPCVTGEDCGCRNQEPKEYRFVHIHAF